jgi:hypothetical protein
MRLTEALEASRCIEARRENATILIDQVTDLDNETLGYWYDIDRLSDRTHNLICGSDLEGLVEELFDVLDVDPYTLDWQTASRQIDLSDCLCAECRELRRSYGLLQPDASLLEKLMHRVRGIVSGLGFDLVITRLRFREWLRRMLRQDTVECEACGCSFEPDSGYVEPEEYSYCSDCCHW